MKPLIVSTIIHLGVIAIACLFSTVSHCWSDAVINPTLAILGLWAVLISAIYALNVAHALRRNKRTGRQLLSNNEGRLPGRRPPLKLAEGATSLKVLPRPIQQVDLLELRITGELAALAAIGRNSNANGWTRYAFSPEEQQAHDHARSRLVKDGFTTHVDVFGNLHGLKITVPEAPVILVGTHLDTVAEGGNYDGVVGYIAAVESARLLVAAAVRFNLEIVIFRAEESTRFGRSLLGSRMAFGFLPEEELEDLRDTLDYDRTATLRHALVKAGLDPANLKNPSIRAGDHNAYLEVHIEQAQVLETNRVPIGVVTSIRAPERWVTTVEGRESMPAVAEMIVAIEQCAEGHSQSGSDVVATVGRVDGGFEGAVKINCVPGQVRFGLSRPAELSELTTVKSVVLKRRIRLSPGVSKDGPHLGFEGVTDHSGGTPMGEPYRRDALVAAARAVAVLPGEILPRPERISFYTDLRSNCEATRNRISAEMKEMLRRVGAKHAVRVDIGQPIEQTSPIPALDPNLRSTLQEAAKALKIAAMDLPSGGGHDAVMAAQAGIPTAMLFVPSVRGLSHNPLESTKTEDIAKAVRVLAGAITILSKRPAKAAKAEKETLAVS